MSHFKRNAVTNELHALVPHQPRHGGKGCAADASVVSVHFVPYEALGGALPVSPAPNGTETPKTKEEVDSRPTQQGESRARNAARGRGKARSSTKPWRTQGRYRGFVLANEVTVLKPYNPLALVRLLD